AIDLVDEAASRLSMELQSVPTEIDVLQRRLLQLQLAERMLRNEEEEHARERLIAIELEIKQIEKQLQDLRGQWEMEKSGLGDIQKVRERLEAVKVEYSRAWDEIRHMQQRGERPDERQFQALAALDAERQALERRIAEAEAQGEGPARGGQRLLKKEVDSEEIAEVVSQWTGIPVARMLATEREKLLRLEEQIHLRLVDQEAA